jgi:hypothetical protein
VQLLLGHTKIESTVRHLGIEVDGAIEDRQLTCAGGVRRLCLISKVAIRRKCGRRFLQSWSREPYDVARVGFMISAKVTRRHVLVAAALGSYPLQVIAQSTPLPGRPAIPPLIRLATVQDLPAIVALLIQDAEARQALDPVLWRIAGDASTRMERAAGAALNGQASARELWFVAEQAGRIVGVTHAMLVPVPPIYDGSAGPPGLLLDDCFISADAPSGTAEALLTATEAALVAAGARRLIASCPAAGPLRPLYERHGYEPVTLYMAKHRFSSDALPPGVRPASAEDVPGIVKRSAEHRRTLARINPRFWHIHPEADGRFDAWMRRSLTLKDRDMLVAVEVDEVHGYIIAQPIAPLLVSAAHEIATVGVIDDFYDEDFADASVLSSGSSGDNLLAAAESAFVRRQIDSTLVVCPAAWSSKVSLLERRGYRVAKLWMLKR